MTGILKHIKNGKAHVDMTEGSIIKHLIVFSIPLLIGNIFQQLYNTVDTWVVGNYVSNEAFSAVGTLGPAINMFISFFMGLSGGTGVIISQYYGAKRYDKTRQAVHTAFAMTLILGVILTFAGIAATPLLIRMMNTPESVVPLSETYLTIYFAGFLGMMIYNIGSGILRAVGDSTHPFYFIVVCAIINTVLDLVFVLAFEMGVAGVALATVMAQCVSAVMVIVTLMRSDECVKLDLRLMKIDLNMLGKIFKVGIPAALQMAITSFSNIFVQSYINQFGEDCMSGWTAYAKIDQLALLPMQSLALASTTFVGQNLGKGNVERTKKGVTRAMLLAELTTVVLLIPIMLFAPALVAFFNDKAEVVEYGTMLLRWLSPFYILCCFNQIYAGALRGAGNSRAPMLIMLGSFVFFRQAYLFVVSNYISNEILAIAMGYPAGWLLCSALTMIYYHKTSLVKTRVVEDDEAAAD